MSNNLESLLEISERMAQELTDFADEGEEGGSEMTGVRNLLVEYENCRANILRFGVFREGCV